MYTLHPKYHTYYILHFDVTFAVMFDGILLHMTSICFLLRWNKLKKQKYPSSKSIKTKLNFFHISLAHVCTHCLDPNSDSCADERLMVCLDGGGEGRGVEGSRVELAKNKRGRVE